MLLIKKNKIAQFNIVMELRNNVSPIKINNTPLIMAK